MSVSHSHASRPAVRAVLFDFGKVLSKPADPAAWQQMLEVTGVSDERLHDAYWHFRHDYDRNALNGAQYWHAVGNRAGASFTAAQIDTLFELDVDLWTKMNEQMVEFAQRLQRAGIRTGILSNIGDAIAHGIVARLPWLTQFDQCTWSYALNMAKPEPAIYLRTAQALRTPPESILFIDDREDNIAAADALGFQTIQYTDHAAFLCEMRDRGYDALLEPAELQFI